MRRKRKKLDQRKRFIISLAIIIVLFLLGLALFILQRNTIAEIPQKITHRVFVTAYTSRPEETDETPFLTASGAYVRDGTAASNFLPLGTLIKIPEYFGDKIFKIEDRMNSKYQNRVDIWFSDLDKAKNFGIRFATIEVL